MFSVHVRTEEKKNCTERTVNVYLWDDEYAGAPPSSSSNIEERERVAHSTISTREVVFSEAEDFPPVEVQITRTLEDAFTTVEEQQEEFEHRAGAAIEAAKEVSENNL